MILDANSFGIVSQVIKKVFRAEFKRLPESELVSNIRETLRESSIALYIHIPFCSGTCTFCPYVRYPVPRSELNRVVEKYVRALLKEIEIYSRILDGEELRVVDIHAGGGTPSLVDAVYWKAILDKICEAFDAEPRIAIEANPENLRNEALVYKLIDAGISEVSLGVQSLNPKMLRVLGRRHRIEDSLRAIENLRGAGCKYINIDLMYMVPGQTLEDWVRDLEMAAQLDVDEITCYPTLVTPQSPGYRLIKSGRIPPQPDMKVFKRMVYACEEILPSRGFVGVEIYGYSRVEGWKYVTVNYEMEGPLLGFGCGAMGFTGGFEYQNVCFVDEYLKSLASGRLPIAGARRTSLTERAIRYTACRLFICRYLNKKDFRHRFGTEFEDLVGKTGFGKVLKLLKVFGAVKEDSDSIHLTRRGLFTAHKVCWAFVLNVPCRIAEEYSKTPWPPRVVIP